MYIPARSNETPGERRRLRAHFKAFVDALPAGEADAARRAVRWWRRLDGRLALLCARVAAVSSATSLEARRPAFFQHGFKLVCVWAEGIRMKKVSRRASSRPFASTRWQLSIVRHIGLETYRRYRELGGGRPPRSRAPPRGASHPPRPWSTSRSSCGASARVS